MGDGRGAYSVSVVKPEGKRPRGRLTRRWEDSIKVELKEIDWDKRRAMMNAVMSLRVP
jgi:hypothetical protein